MNTGYSLKNGSDISTLYARASNKAPPGSIMPYLGTTDIDGWILCDGIERNNNQDGRYNTVFNLGIGAGGNLFTSYTPPNLQNTYLRGASNSQSILSTGGKNTVQLGIDQLPSHGHFGTINNDTESTISIDVSHSHALYNEGRHYETTTDNRFDRECVDKQGFLEKKDPDGIRTEEISLIRSITVPAHNHTLEIQSTGLGKAFSILPTFMTVNYLLKL